jgi:hypothetical protein
MIAIAMKLSTMLIGFIWAKMIEMLATSTVKVMKNSKKHKTKALPGYENL